jgi:hypothetical protein
MVTQNTQLSAVFRRLDCLEKRDRLWKKGAAALLLLAGTASIMAANQGDSTPDLVAAKQIQLKDGEGRVRAILAMSNAGQPAIILLDEHGKQRLELSSVGPTINLNDEQQKTRATLQIAPNGDPKVAVFNKNGERLAVQIAATDKGGQIETWNAQNETTFIAKETGAGAQMWFQQVR